MNGFRTSWTLNDEEWYASLERIDAAPSPSPELRALLARAPRWDHLEGKAGDIRDESD